MSDLTDFLNARIDEDEAVAREVGPATWSEAHSAKSQGVSSLMWDANRILAECEAKRRATALLTRSEGPVDAATVQALLKIMALPYVEHRDFREDWHL